MNLKVLFLIICYYAVISIFLSFGLSYTDDDYTYSNPLNDSSISNDEIDTGGLFGTGVSFTRFTGLITVGVGLPGNTPIGFKSIFVLWQSLVTILTIGFIISSIWDG